jgi:NADH-quinone oxidoreductase subunit L
MHRFIWLVPLLPLAGAAINGLFGRRFRFSEKVISTVAVGSVALAFLLSVAAVVSYGFGDHSIWPKPYVNTDMVFTWIPGGPIEITQGQAEREKGAAHVTPGTAVDSHGREITPTEHTESARNAGGEAFPGGHATEARKTPAAATAKRGSVLDVKWSYQLDPLSAVFMLIVTGVGLCIFVFATGYMHGDQGFYRFFAYLGLFMFSMLVLVMGSSFVMMFVGWEGVGLCSYLLIGYYFDRKEAGDASRKAFITNRIGDFGFALAVFGIIATFGSANYVEVFEAAKSFPIELIGGWGLMSWLALGLFVGAIGKSAQIPLYVWLPDAMAGPTPVSALIHAATMVTAGLYMLARTNVIFQHSQTMMWVVAIVGALTALFAATIGITQNDIKKVLAYSTVSQLGFMFLACGVGAFVIGIFHVMTHAFFKALMFLGAGSVIHGMHHEQDIRRMGGLKKYMPKTYWTFLAGWLAICGIIPFSGFWSKDEILWNVARTTHVPGGWLLWIIATIAATCTAFYMTRLVAMTFWGKERFLELPAGGQADEAHAHGYAEHEEPHDAMLESIGDRPRHEPGEYVGEPHAAPHAHISEHGTPFVVHDEPHGHVTHMPHESPRSMWIPLAVLAVLAIVGGLVGISPAFTGGAHVGGKLNIVNWLQPVMWDPATGEFSAEHARTEKHDAAAGLIASIEPAPTSETATSAKHGAAISPYGDTGFNLAHAVEEKFGGHTAAEWFFIVVSLVVAGLGILLGLLFYVWRPALPDLWADRLGVLYRASYNKYWVDELYGAAITRRTMDLARAVYQADSKIVDGAVNGAAWLTRRASDLTGTFDRVVVDGVVNGLAGFIKRLMSPLIRAAQTGLAPNYALVMVLGVVAAFVLFYGRDILSAFTSFQF